MKTLALIALALSLCGCGLAARQDLPLIPSVHQPDTKDQTIAQLRQRIDADQRDIVAAKAEIQAKQEASWATLAYITAGVLVLGVLVFAFLAFEAPMFQGKLAAASLFSAAAAIVCIYAGQHIHAVLLTGPFIIAAGIIGTIWVMRHKDKVKADADNLSTFIAGQWKIYGQELSDKAPDSKTYLDASSLNTQRNIPGLTSAVNGVLAKL